MLASGVFWGAGAGQQMLPGCGASGMLGGGMGGCGGAGSSGRDPERVRVLVAVVGLVQVGQWAGWVAGWLQEVSCQLYFIVF